MPGAATTANTTLPPGLEVFKAGRRRDDSGRDWEFTKAQVADIAAAYEPTLREAPLTIGHPANDKPAYGWAAKFSARDEDGTLLMDSRDVEPQFAEMHRTRRFPKVSMAFYTPDHPNNPKPGRWYPRHVTFLGAQPPAVAGLKDPTFADNGEGLVCFSEANEEDRMSKELQDKADAEKQRADQATAEAARATAEAKAATDKLAQFAEQQRTATHAAHVQFAEKMLGEGRLKKPEVAQAVAALDFIAGQEGQVVQFSEGTETKTVSVVDFMKGRIAAAAPLANFSEVLPGGDGSGVVAGQPLSDADLDKAAKAYATKHNVNYSEALTKVASFTQQ